MGLYFVAVLLTSVALVSGSSTLGVVTALDPGRITSWRQQWPSLPVELSYTNAQEQEVVVMLRLNVPHGISQGVVEVVFPEGFDVSTAFCMETNCQHQPTIQGQTVILLGVTLEAGKDSTVTLGGIANPSTPGGYGYFGIRTRTCAGCQTLDLNLAFSSVGITGSVGTMKTVGLTIPAGVPFTRATSLTLDFAFVISKDLWRHDTIRITLSKYWTLASPICISKTYPGRTVTNFLAEGLTTSFGCSVTDKATSPDNRQVLYVYGLGKDLEVSKSDDNKYIVLSVTGFTAPYYDYPEDFYIWNVETLRCTSRNVLERGNILSGPSVNPTAIPAATWKSTWNYPDNSKMMGMQMYMDMSFSLPYEVPFGGYIQVVTTGATVNTFWGTTNCYLKERYVGKDPQRPWVTNIGSCTANGAYSILVSNLPDLAKGQTFTLRSLVSFQATTGVQIASITSYTAEGYAINAGFNLAAQTINTADRLLSVFDIVMTTAGGTSSDSDTNIAGGTADYSYYLKFRIDPRTEEIISTTKFNISCPFSTALDDFRIYLPADSNTLYQVRKNTDLATASDFSTGATYTSLTRPTITSISSVDPFTIQSYFEIGPSADLTTTTGQSLVLGISRTTSGPGLGWPRVATNAFTTYECYITMTDTSTAKDANGKSTAAVTQRGIAQFTIRPRDWSTANAKYFCSHNYAGAPVYVSVQPSLFDVSYTSATKQFYVEFEFVETMALDGSFYPRFDSGLDDYSEYPYDLDDPATSFQPGFEQKFSFQIYSENLRTKLRITNFENLRITQSYALLFPIGEQLSKDPATSTKAQVTMRSYYVMTADDRVKYVQHESVTNLEADFSTSVSALNTLDWSFGDYVMNGEVLSRNARLKIQTTKGAANQNSNWIFFILPQGYSLVNPTVKEGNWDIWSAVNSFTQPHYFTSTNPYFKFPSVIVKCTISACVSNLADRFVEIAGLKPSLGVPCNYKDSIRVVVTDRSDRSGTCLNSATISHTTLAGEITIMQFQPQEIVARGPNSVDFSAKVVFKTQHGGYGDSMITMSIDEQFQCISGVTTCAVEGLTDFNSTTPLRCQMIGNEVLIDQFADFTSSPNTIITLTIAHLNPPQRSWNDRVHFIASFRSRTRDGRRIDNWTTSDADLVKVTPAEPQGRSSIRVLETVPLNGGQQVADLHLGFSLPHEIPALAGKIEILSPVSLLYTPGNIQNKCWVSGLRYTTCSTDGMKITLTFVQKYTPGTQVEVYLDGAVGSLAGNQYTTTSFGITSYWGDAIIDRDHQPDPNQYIDVKAYSHRLKTLATPSLQIASVAFSFDPTTAGELSWYTFTIQLNDRLLQSDQLWVIFPQDAFDAYVGPAEALYTSTTNKYFVPCMSPHLGTVRCTADHWVVRVFPGNAVEKLRDITISISVFNPPHRRGYALDVAHTTEEGEVKAILRGAAVVIPTAPALNIVVKNITSSSQNVRDTATCRLSMFFSQAINTTSRIQVKFPKQFDLFGGQLPCNSTWLDQSPGATVSTQQEWNSASTCNVKATNLLTLDPPATATNFDQSKLVTLRIDGANPEWGDKRTGDLLWDFDKQNLISHPDYDVWTGLWEVFVYDTVAKAYTSRAYPNLHCGYSGFLTPRRQLIANNYNPALNVNRVKVGAGLQSDEILISAPDAFVSKTLQLNATISSQTGDRGYLTLTSSNDFMLYQTESKLYFRVAADKNLMPGTYLIEWKASEVTQPGVLEGRYHPPVKTLVEVFKPEPNSVPITLTHTDAVAVGTVSVPLQVRLASAPAVQLIVHLELSMEIRGVTLRPNVLTFEAGVDTQYFEVMLDSDFDVNSIDQLLFVFWLGGDNSDLYQIPFMTSVNVVGEQSSSPSLLSWNLLGCSRTKCTLSPAFSTPGVFYWQLSATGTPPLSLLQLQAKIDRLSDSVSIENEDGFIDRNYLNDFRPASHVDPDEDESWEDFQRRLYRAHVMTSYYGRAIQYAEATSITFDWLWAQTDYTLCGYFVDMFEAQSEPLMVSLTTEPLANAAELVLGYSAQETTEDFVNGVAEALGVNPKRLFYDAMAAADPAATSLTLSLVADRFVEAQDPTSLPFSATTLNAVLTSHSLASSPSVSFSTVAARANMTVTEPLQVAESGLTWVELTLNTSSIGEVCCVANPINSTLPTASQVWLGLSRTNEYLPRTCSPASQGRVSMRVRGLVQASQYTVACVLADSYPLWRTLTQDVQSTVASTKIQQALITQKEEVIPQAGGTTIMEDVNAADTLKGLTLLAFLFAF